jgi:hypothetical protein
VNVQGFEFVELRNIARRAVDLSGVKLARGVDFDFQHAAPGHRLLQPGESVVLVSDKRAFSVRYPHISATKIAGRFRNHLDNGGETISVLAADGSLIKEFRFDNAAPWPATNELGHSFILNSPSTNPDQSDPANWSLSAKTGGTPGESGFGADSFSGAITADSDQDGFSDLFEFASGSDPENPGSFFRPFISIVTISSNGSSAAYAQLSFHRRPTAMGVKLLIETSADLLNWSETPSLLVPAGSTANPDGTVTEIYRGAAPLAANPSASVFYRIKAALQ